MISELCYWLQKTFFFFFFTKYSTKYSTPGATFRHLDPNSVRRRSLGAARSGCRSQPGDLQRIRRRPVHLRPGIRGRQRGPPATGTKKTDPGVRLFLAACVGCTATSAAPSKKIRRCTLCPALIPTPSGRQPFLVSAPARLLFPAGHAQRPASPRHPTRREEVRRPHGRQSDTTSVWLSTLRTRISCAAPL